MQRKDFEKVCQLKKRIMELERVSEVGIPISGKELRRMKEEYEKLKNQFDVFAESLPCDIYMLLELRYIYAWPYYMIKRHLYWVKGWNVNPREMIDEYFTSEEQKSHKRQGVYNKKK